MEAAPPRHENNDTIILGLETRMGELHQRACWILGTCMPTTYKYARLQDTPSMTEETGIFTQGEWPRRCPDGVEKLQQRCKKVAIPES